MSFNIVINLNAFNTIFFMEKNDCDEKIRTLEYVCHNEKCYCFKMPENFYDYCGAGLTRKVECSKRALTQDYTGLYPCFKYPRSPNEESGDEQGYSS